MSRDVSLICEGRCNDGAVQEFDAAVRAAGRSAAPLASGEDARTTTLLDPRWLDDARDFRYTRHERAGVVYGDEAVLSGLKLAFVCVECGTKRVFGFA